MVKDDQEFITTTYACELLGVSKTVIKRMADDGELETWKTPGGHRRLKKESVLKVLQSKLGVTGGHAISNGVVKILVIDDDPTIRALLSSVVACVDFPVELIAAKDGFEGLLKAGEQEYNIILVDINMPKLDGYEVIQTIRNSSRNQEATIVLITASEESEIEFSKLPSDILVLTKPLNIPVLKQFLKYENRLK